MDTFGPLAGIVGLKIIAASALYINVSDVFYSETHFFQADAAIVLNGLLQWLAFWAGACGLNQMRQ